MFNLKLFRNEYETSLSLPLQISIGEVDMSVSEILSLESGREVFFKLGDSSLVTFLLGGEPLATACMKIEGDQVIFKINEVFLNQVAEKSDNQEEALSELEI